MLETNPTVIRNFLRVLKAHQVYPLYNVPAYGKPGLRDSDLVHVDYALYRTETSLCERLKLQVLENEEFVRQLLASSVKSPSRYTQYFEWVPSSVCVVPAFEMYLFIKDIDTLCDYLGVDALSPLLESVGVTFNFHHWFLELALAVHSAGGLPRKHATAYSDMIAQYKMFGTLYVLDIDQVTVRDMSHRTSANSEPQNGVSETHQ